MLGIIRVHFEFSVRGCIIKPVDPVPAQALKYIPREGITWSAKYRTWMISKWALKNYMRIDLKAALTIPTEELYRGLDLDTLYFEPKSDIEYTQKVNYTPNTEADKWERVVFREELIGKCLACGKEHVYALWTVYGNFDEVFRCSACNAVNNFIPDDKNYYDNAKRWKPLGNDEDDETYTNGSGRYTKGTR